MAIYETEGLILKSYSLAEADKIVVILTQKNGLIRGVAKGAKRLKSRFGGGLEPFSVVNISFYQKEERELVSLSQVDLKKSFFDVAATPEFLQKFSYLADLLNEFAPPNEPNERLYRMACACLETANSNSQTLESVGLYFELWLLRLAGYLPNWNRCADCQRELNTNENASLQINFQILCLNCQKGGNRWNLTPQERQIFTNAQLLSPTKFVEYVEDKAEDVKDISSVLKRLISHVLGKESVGERVILSNGLVG